MKTIRLSLHKLYESSDQKRLFLQRLNTFLQSDRNLQAIIKVEKSTLILTYQYNELLCKRTDPSKRNLILVFGNPSPHSIKEKIMFSYEGANFRTHRVWKVLSETRIINLDGILLDQTHKDYKTAGKIRNGLIRSGKASDEFNVSMLSYFSFPSASSALTWSGVAGIKKLFGSTAWSKIKKIENDRFLKNLSSYTGDSKILVFQKDAYDNIVENGRKSNVELLSPTRLWYSTQFKNQLIRTVFRS